MSTLAADCALEYTCDGFIEVRSVPCHLFASCNERMGEMFVSTHEMQGMALQLGILGGFLWGR